MVNQFPKSRRSGGPKTAEGKALASRNSLKHGAYAVQEVLPGEDLQQFLELKQQFISEYEPSGITVLALVDSLANIAWKKLRIEQLEYRHIRNILIKEIYWSELSDAGVKDCPELAKAYVIDPKLIESCDAELAREQYRYALALREFGFDGDQLARLQKESPNTFRALKERMLEKCELKSISLFDMATYQYSLSDKRKVFADVLDGLIADAHARKWVADNKKRILFAYQQIRDERLKMALRFEMPQRAINELDRQFTKTLAEIRKHQDWHRERRMIDITPRKKSLPRNKSKP